MKLSHFFYIINVVVLLIFYPTQVLGQEKWVVVLDAGHGGKDPGTVNGKVYEKDINLAVALKAGAILEKNPNIEVIYTRKDDTFIELSRRSQIATQAKADLFVSIHANSAANKSAYGSDTYILGTHKDEDNLKAAMRENSVISLEKNYSTTYEGYDPTSSESLIMFSLMQYAYTRESLKLASLLQKNYKAIGRRDRGVKQAGFLVLWKTTMPSILTEVGFVSNAEEVKYLASEAGQSKIAESLAKSIIEYTSNNNQIVEEQYQVNYTPQPDSNKSTPQTPIKQEEKKSDNKAAYYSIQFYATSQPMEINSKNFGKYVMQVKEQKIGNSYKYTISKLYIYKEALLLQHQVRQSHSKAFIVAFDQNGNPIEVRDARKILENR